MRALWEHRSIIGEVNQIQYEETTLGTLEMFYRVQKLKTWLLGRGRPVADVSKWFKPREDRAAVYFR